MAALPQMVQSTKGQMFDVNSPQGKMIVNSPNYKPPFSASSSALAPMKPENSALSAMGPMQSIQAIFSNMADSLESIKESAISLVAAAEGDARGDALASANVEGGVNPEVPEFGGEEDDGDGKPSRMPSLKKLGLTLLIAGVIFFAEKLKPILAKVLEGFKFIYNILKTSFLAVFDYVKEFFNDPVGTLKKSLDAVLDGLASLGAWIWDKGIKPVWDWITGLFDSGAGATIKEKFLAVAGVFTSFGQWIWDKAIKPVWDWISGIFGKDGEEDGGSVIKKIFDAYVTAWTSIGGWIWDNAIKPVWDWISGIFSFSEDETEKDPNYEPFSIIGLVTDAIKGIGKFLKDMFTFDPSAFKEKLFDFGTFIKALAFAVPAAMKAVVSQAWTDIGPSEAFEKSFNETMSGGTSASDITPSGNSSTEELQTVTDQFTRGQGSGTTFIQDFSQKSDVKQQNGDVVLGADLSADDSDPTEKVLGRVVRPGGFSDVRLKEDIKLVRKSPSDINIYEFKYIGEEGKYEGVMAQEVPWASSIADNGFLWVDYTKLDVDFIKLS